MRVAFFSTKPYDRDFFQADPQAARHDMQFFEPRLTEQTVQLAQGFEAVCVFVNDVLDRETLEHLAKGGTRVVALRCAGFNNVDLETAQRLGMAVVRVPAYSPYAVAEHTVGMMLTLSRKFHRAHARVREGNFALNSLLGFDLNGRTVGIVGTGRIGQVATRILAGFGCRLLGHDVVKDADCEALGLKYVDLEQVYRESDIITLHVPLTPQTHHMINRHTLQQMKSGVMLINTSRGPLVDTRAVIHALKQGHLGYLGIDVYEEEADLFFEDLSDQVLQDDVFARLVTFPNVLITAHQGFFTREALERIAATTLENLTLEQQGQVSPNRVTVQQTRSK